MFMPVAMLKIKKVVASVLHSVNMYVCMVCCDFLHICRKLIYVIRQLSTSDKSDVAGSQLSAMSQPSPMPTLLSPPAQLKSAGSQALPRSVL